MPDKHEVGGSSPLEPTIGQSKIGQQMFIENRIKRIESINEQIIEKNVKLLR